MSVLLELRCHKHPKYNAVQYPRKLKYEGHRCLRCLLLWQLRHDARPGIDVITAGSNP